MTPREQGENKINERKVLLENFCKNNKNTICNTKFNMLNFKTLFTLGPARWTSMLGQCRMFITPTSKQRFGAHMAQNAGPTRVALCVYLQQTL